MRVLLLGLLFITAAAAFMACGYWIMNATAEAERRLIEPSRSGAAHVLHERPG